MRLILDTMLWGYIGQTGSREKFERCALAHGWKVCTPPATLMETFRDTNAERRTAGILALMSPHWVRLHTEADMECMEIVAEAKRLRPKWVRQLPRPGRPAALRDFWKHQIWRATARDPDYMALFRSPGKEQQEREEVKLVDAMRWNRRERLRVNRSSWRLDDITVTPTDDALVEDLYGWEAGVPVEPWRLQGRDVLRYALRNRHGVDRPDVDTTVADWLDPYLHLNNMVKDKDDFGRFWLFEVERTRMPRHWMRWAIQESQTMAKVRSSDGRDGQIASYLFDAEVFLTEDGNFFDALERVKEVSLTPFADVRRVRIHPNDADVVEIIESALT
ncbi:hypothetical protein ITP53_00145 [Nonomuraea sp. K274]|uniref:Uncharacterized protein n=1 Tax=Nonomuraea cypriaca TaxID=1187855 RepID=A0A931A0Y6_9ACTN|nr:hypothetical protein [Nonomuraea cypriaca]MBF8184182.1 hypothetical protein [Nonomuraea cypriaca]